VTKLGYYPIVLGIPWLQQHDVCLLFAQNKLIFNSNYCLYHSLHDALHVQRTTQDPPPLYLDSIVRPLGHKVIDTQKTQKVIPPEYHDFLPHFLEEGSRPLALKRPGIDHKINFKHDFQPPFRPLHGVSQAELMAQKKWLNDNLEKGFI
jgi:hypothetical protein